MPGRTIIAENICGWCGKELKSTDNTEHALVCKEQPYQVFKRRLRAELVALHIACAGNGILPRGLEEAIRIAEEDTLEHIRKTGWRFGKEGPEC